MKLVIVQTIIPTYRIAVFSKLSRPFLDIDLLAGDVSYDSDLTTDPAVDPVRTRVANHFFLGRRLLWQSGVVKRAVVADAVVMEMNPRALSTWAAAVVRRILKRPVVLWGHAWPRGGAGVKTDRIRNVMRRLANVVVVYTETQARELQDSKPGIKVVAAPNALYSTSEALDDVQPTSRYCFVYVGRMNEAKKPILLLRAFAKARQAFPEAALVFAGFGTLEADLKMEAQALGVADGVEFAGEVFNYEAVNALYARAVASVSPGYAGLSLTQSLWFGVPMLIARDEPHAPEIEAAVEGETAYFFESDSVDALSAKLIEVWECSSVIDKSRCDIASACRKTYSVESMAGRLIEAAELSITQRS